MLFCFQFFLVIRKNYFWYFSFWTLNLNTHEKSSKTVTELIIRSGTFLTLALKLLSWLNLQVLILTFQQVACLIFFIKFKYWKIYIKNSKQKKIKIRFLKSNLIKTFRNFWIINFNAKMILIKLSCLFFKTDTSNFLK